MLLKAWSNKKRKVYLQITNHIFLDKKATAAARIVPLKGNILMIGILVWLFVGFDVLIF